MDETCTLGTGPLTDEELATKHLGVDIAEVGVLRIFKASLVEGSHSYFLNGIIAYLYGPVSARENDIALLDMSWLNEHLMALQPEIAEW